MPGVPPPEVLSLQVCERVVLDKLTDQASVINIVRIINSEGFPLTLPHLYVFFEFAGGHGPMPLEFRVVDAGESRTPVFLARFEINFTDPRRVVQYWIVGLSVKFPEPGEYRAQVFCNGELLRQRALVLNRGPLRGVRVEQVPKGPP